MTTQSFLQMAQQQLATTGIGTARLDALVLLEDATGLDRAQLLAHPETELTAEQQTRLSGQIEQRKTHEPIAYIRGKTEFYGRNFAITHRVLEPRPESEMMIDLLKKLVQSDKSLARNQQDLRLVDVGSGSGCLGITAALELGLQRCDFGDIDPQTLNVARQNANIYAVDGALIESDLLAATTSPYDIVLANLPYVPDSFQINEAALREPAIAIFGGPDGLDLYRQLFSQLRDGAWQARYVLTEALPPQHEQLTAIAQEYGYTLIMAEDFIQVFAPVPKPQ